MLRSDCTLGRMESPIRNSIYFEELSISFGQYHSIEVIGVQST